jgi:hypothetical protein
MPVAAPVTRAVFPLMNMSHFLKYLVSSDDKHLEKQTVKVVLVNPPSLIALRQVNVNPTRFSRYTRPTSGTDKT